MQCENGVCRLDPAAAGRADRALWLHDYGADYLSVRWHRAQDATRYELQWRAHGSDAWDTASISSNTVRKRGLAPSTGYEFRVRHRDAIDWSEWGDVSNVHVTLADGAARPGAPVLKDAGGLDVVVQWDRVPDADRYEVQFAEPDREWQTASAKLKGTSVRKKMPTAGLALEVRVRALVVGVWGVFSPPSSPICAAPLAETWTRNLGRSLISMTPTSSAIAVPYPVPTQALAGGLVCLFAAASW